MLSDLVDRSLQPFTFRRHSGTKLSLNMHALRAAYAQRYGEASKRGASIGNTRTAQASEIEEIKAVVHESEVRASERERASQSARERKRKPWCTRTK
jgi:hypothetical protein